MALVDEVQLHIKAGDGGDGVVRWRQEKFKPKGGPAGGNGGKGGDVYAEVVSDLAYLDFYTQKKKFSAENGNAGGNNNKEGKNGEDITLKFPRGTLLTNLATGEEFNLAEVGSIVQILKGGRGGLGNTHFKASTNTTPMEWTPGLSGEEADFSVELRLFADLGLVGLPSAGKSTLLNTLTNAKSKVGEYHFTTLDPHLGAMGEYILADIPGIIQGASSGKGLGHKFLRHIIRTSALVHVVALDSDKPLEDYQIIRKELAEYSVELSDKEEIILLSKSDMLAKNEVEKTVQKFKEFLGHNRIYTMSAFDDESIKDFKSVLVQYLEKKVTINNEKK